jgi:hypothetical protein
MKRKKTLAVLALAGTALLTQAAQAAGTNTYSTGDLLLGFSESGATNDYLVDLGSASTYLNDAASNPGQTFTVSTSLNADLSSSSLFGSGWETNSNVTWGIAGATTAATTLSGVPNSTLFFSEEAGSSALLAKSAGTQGPVTNSINGSLGTDFNNSATTSNNSSATIELASGSTSWATLSANAFGAGYDIVSTGTPGDSVLDLYELEPLTATGRGAPTSAPGILVGDFSLNSSGTLDFTAAGSEVVPEPSTYALMGAGMALLFWRLRRKTARA